MTAPAAPMNADHRSIIAASLMFKAPLTRAGISCPVETRKLPRLLLERANQSCKNDGPSRDPGQTVRAAVGPIAHSWNLERRSTASLRHLRIREGAGTQISTFRACWPPVGKLRSGDVTVRFRGDLCAPCSSEKQ